MNWHHLILDVTPGEEAGTWHALDAAGGQQMQGDLSAQVFSSLPGMPEITLIVPADNLLLTQALLPNAGKSALRAALPFALENQLIDEVDSLHFALGPKNNNAAWPVAVTARKHMEAWNTLVRQTGGVATRIVPDIFTLPAPDTQWTICVHASRCFARTGSMQGFSCSLATAEQFLAAALRETDTRPTAIEWRFLSEHSDFIPPDLQDIAVHKTFSPVAEWVASIPSVLAIHPFINLAQGDFQLTGTHFSARWKTAALLAGAACLAAFVSHAGLVFSLAQENASLKKNIYAIYHRHFPKAVSVMAPRLRMMEKLRTAGGGQGVFVHLLAQTGNALSRMPSVQLAWLQYENHLLKAGVTAGSFGEIDTLMAKLSAEGMAVKQQNATTQGKQAKATLLIGAGGQA